MKYALAQIKSVRNIIYSVTQLNMLGWFWLEQLTYCVGLTAGATRGMTYESVVRILMSYVRFRTKYPRSKKKALNDFFRSLYKSKHLTYLIVTKDIKLHSQWQRKHIAKTRISVQGWAASRARHFLFLYIFGTPGKLGRYGGFVLTQSLIAHCYFHFPF